MRNNPYKKIWIFGILIIFIGTSFLPLIIAKTNYYEIDEKDLSNLSEIQDQDASIVTLYAIEETSTKENKIDISTEDAEIIFNLFKELKQEITQDPYSEKTQHLRNEFVSLLDVKGILPKGVTKNKFISLLSPPSLNHPKSNTIFNRINNLKNTMINPLFNRIIQRLDNRFNNIDTPIESFDTSATLNFCTIASYGDGYTIPVMIPVRPRIGIAWNASSSETYAGEVFSNKGFYAVGTQSGSTVGFTGGGGTFAFPGAKFYVFVGYTWHVKIYAEHINFFPPNYEPEISDVYPINGAVDVPVSLSELSFKISDIEGAPMDYKVTTYPDIGSGEGKGKPNGKYSIPVSNLDGSTTYTWTIQVSDDKNNVEKSFTFTTELEYPMVSYPSPSDGEAWVSTDITELSFKIIDPQHDLMDYTVETVPDIGSDSATGVDDGTYTCDISNLEYTTIYKWYINVTDGEHMTRKIYSFQTQSIMVFDPFEEGWMYRKNITIDHTKISGSLNNFPVLISITDEDLKNKAQNDGDDILFMDGPGTAERIFHEIDQYDSSTGELIAWVNINSLSNSADTIFYIYYGNPSCVSQQYPGGVWDSYYCGVWHLSDSYDSTKNDNNGVIIGATLTEGIINDCLNFDGNNDYVNILDTNDFQFSDQSITFSTWVQIVDNEDYYRCVIGFGDAKDGIPRFKLVKQRSGTTDGRMATQIYNGIGNSVAFSIDNGDNLPKNEWIYLNSVVDYENSLLKLYINTELQESVDLVNYDLSDSVDLKLFFGSTPWSGYNGEHNRYKGLIDEVRISKTSRSIEWISTQYNNQNDVFNFFTIGPEET